MVYLKNPSELPKLGRDSLWIWVSFFLNFKEFRKSFFSI